ncbi:unnamed protein product [Adineta steineri]|uniref:Uncharacterized protein n=1 Tax=Adineta steineri TaxID=433720 RepID=A0A814ERL0_9BILA|nr:unnamed protein product [Adineta steineri]CAF0972762.1 unnamed protein product [Adineta steineri]
MFVVLIVTIPIVIIKTKTANIIKLSTEKTEITTHEFITTTADNPTIEVQTKPKYDKWKQHGITIVGGNRIGDQLNQLAFPTGAYIDDKKAILIADFQNHRIVEWKYNSNSGQIVAGGGGRGHNQHQLNMPTDVIVDEEKNAIIICDSGNNRVVRWFRESTTYPETIIANIHCDGVAIDKNGSIYVSDRTKSEVKRWKERDISGTLVAGGNGKGNLRNQFNNPGKIFVDEDYSVYVLDEANHRVMKWKKDAKEGIVVAGGNGRGFDLNQLTYPSGLVVDNLGRIIIADTWNHRIIRWCEGDTNGSIVLGGNGNGGSKPNELYLPKGVLFDIEGNLYVVDCSNHRIQKYEQCIE